MHFPVSFVDTLELSFHPKPKTFSQNITMYVAAYDSFREPSHFLMRVLNFVNFFFGKHIDQKIISSD